MGLRSLASDTITNVTDCLLSPGVNEYDVGETKKKGNDHWDETHKKTAGGKESFICRNRNWKTNNNNNKWNVKEISEEKPVCGSQKRSSFLTGAHTRDCVEDPGASCDSHEHTFECYACGFTFCLLLWRFFFRRQGVSFNNDDDFFVCGFTESFALFCNAQVIEHRSTERVSSNSTHTHTQGRVKPFFRSLGYCVIAVTHWHTEQRPRAGHWYTPERSRPKIIHIIKSVFAMHKMGLVECMRILPCHKYQSSALDCEFVCTMPGRPNAGRPNIMLLNGHVCDECISRTGSHSLMPIDCRLDFLA